MPSLPSPRSHRLLLAACALLATLAPGLHAAPQPPREISPTLVGTNLWYGDPDDAVWKQVEAGSFSLIRIGGHAYDKKLPDDATLVAWVKKIRAHGAEPVLQMSQYQPPERAAALVELFNKKRAADAPVRFWNIGNEPWLQAGRPDGYAGIPEKIAGYFKPTAAAMKAVDPTIKIYGPNECALFPKIYEPLFGGAHDITGKIPGKNYYYIDGLSWHRYPQTDNEPGLKEIEDFRRSIAKARELVDAANTKHRRRDGDALQWGIGEFNAKGGRQVHTFGNGQMFGAVYALSATYGATYATSWSMFENGGARRGTDFSAFDGRDFTPRASYWHQRFIAEYFTGTTVAASSPNENVLVFAARDKKAGRVAIMILNLAATPALVPYELRFGASPPTKQTLAIEIPLGLDRVYADTIAGRSTQVLVFADTTLKRIRYTAADFDAGRPPTTVSSPAPFRLPR